MTSTRGPDKREGKTLPATLGNTRAITIGAAQSPVYTQLDRPLSQGPQSGSRPRRVARVAASLTHAGKVR
jgi:hypothetical protein